MTTIVGGYLDPTGLPVRATQAPSPDWPNMIGGFAVAKAWVCRWIVAACPEVGEVFADGEGALNWDHGRTRFKLRPGEWVVWTGHEFRVVPPERFVVEYGDASYESDPDVDSERPDDNPLWRTNFRLWLGLRLASAARYAFRCPECGTRPDRHKWSRAPRWDRDPVARRFGWITGRCPRCGHADD